MTVGKNEFKTDFIFTSKIDKKIKTIFKSKVGVKKYYTPKDICPELGLQQIQHDEKLMNKEDPEGFCVSWSIWYAHLRILNPDISQKNLIKLAIENIKNSPFSFTEFIRNYANYLHMMRKFLHNIDPIEKIKHFIENEERYIDDETEDEFESEDETYESDTETEDEL